MEREIVVKQRRFISGHSTVGGEEEGDMAEDRPTSLAFGSGWTALDCIDPNKNI